MDLKNRGQHSALEATTVLNEQGHNQHRGQNPNDLHAGNLQLKVNQALLSPHACPTSCAHFGATMARCMTSPGMPATKLGRRLVERGDCTLATGATDGVALFQHTSPFMLFPNSGPHRRRQRDGRAVLQHREKTHVQAVHKASVFALHVDGEGTLWSGDGNGTLCRWSCQGPRLRTSSSSPPTLGKSEASKTALRPSRGWREGRWCVLDLAGTILQRVPAHPRSCYWAMHWPQKCGGQRWARRSLRPSRRRRGAPAKSIRVPCTEAWCATGCFGPADVTRTLKAWSTRASTRWESCPIRMPDR